MITPSPPSKNVIIQAEKRECGRNYITDHQQSIDTILPTYRMNCFMAQELITFVGILQNQLNLGPLKDFLPFFELVGSMAEQTRVGLANEIDIGLKFESWMNQALFKVEEDPFTLKKAGYVPPFMEQFFAGNKFEYHKFMFFLLDAVDKAINDIFGGGRNPPNLKCVTTNKEWMEGRTPCKGECKKVLECNDFEQCEQCAVTVSQTKSGVALQFEFVWQDMNIYCSIDLIPVFQIEPIPTMKLARLIIDGMLCNNPPEGWLKFLFKYPKDNKIIQELTESGSGHVCSVGLKTMNFLEERNHHIKPAQEFSGHKFSSPRMKDIYSYIKFLKKALDLDLSSYWVKKELLKPEYQSILDLCSKGRILYTSRGEVDGQLDKDDKALVMILSQPEFKTKVEDKIDFQQSFKWSYVRLRREWHQRKGRYSDNVVPKNSS